jgi:hypothetical protein
MEAPRIEWVSPGGNHCWFSPGFDPNKVEEGWTMARKPQQYIVLVEEDGKIKLKSYVEGASIPYVTILSKNQLLNLVWDAVGMVNRICHD